MICGEVQVLVDAGSFGYGSAGHSHSDSLSLVVRQGGEDLLWDAGTFQYVGPGPWRDRFRGSAAHNTIRVDSCNQATLRGPFGWKAPPVVKLLEWVAGEDLDYLDAECIFLIPHGQCRHRRRVALFKTANTPWLLVVLDLVDGPPGEHLVEQFWHAAPGARLRLDGALRDEASGDYAWRSPVFGTKEPASVACVSRQAAFPVRLAAVLNLSTQEEDVSPSFIQADDRDVVKYGDWKIVFPLSGRPSATHIVRP
jgi:hypothetical protein